MHDLLPHHTLSTLRISHSISYLGCDCPQVRDLGATRELLSHHLSDLDDILSVLRIRNGANYACHTPLLHNLICSL